MVPFLFNFLETSYISSSTSCCCFFSFFFLFSLFFINLVSTDFFWRISSSAYFFWPSGDISIFIIISLNSSNSSAVFSCCIFTFLFFSWFAKSFITGICSTLKIFGVPVILIYSFFAYLIILFGSYSSKLYPDFIIEYIVSPFTVCSNVSSINLLFFEVWPLSISICMLIK